MLEFYQAYATYEDLMETTEELFRQIAVDVNEGRMVLEYQGNVIDITPPWARYSFLESLTRIGDVPQGALETSMMLSLLRGPGHRDESFEGHGKLLTKIFELLVEPKLIQPTFIYRYPLEVSPLSRKTEGDPEFVDRFELFMAAREMANAFSELNDPRDQRERFSASWRRSRRGTRKLTRWTRTISGRSNTACRRRLVRESELTGWLCSLRIPPLSGTLFFFLI